MHLDYVLTKTILAGELVRHWEVIDLLVFVHRLINERLDALGRPKYVPLIAFGLTKGARLHDSLDEFGVGFHHLEEHLKLRLFILARLRVAKYVYTITVDLQ